MKYSHLLPLLSLTLTTLPAWAEETSWDRVPSLLEKIEEPSFPYRTFPVTDFGAVADDELPDGEAIRKAIRACHKAGGGTVLVKGGTFRSGAIHLLSNVNLHVAEGTTIQFSTDPEDYLPLVRTRYEGSELKNISPLIYAFEQENIAVTGKGTLDGGATENSWWGWDWDDDKNQVAWESKFRLLDMNDKGTPVEERVFGIGSYLRPNFVQPFRCKNVLIEGVTILRAPMWVLHPLECENVTVRDVTVSSHGPNNDGCNPESSRYVLIEGCTFDTGDDCIAIKAGKNADGRRLGLPSENIVIRNNRMKDGHGGVVLGSEVSGDIRNVFVEDCVMDSPQLDRALRFKSNTVRGGVVENIYMRNVTVGATAIAVVTANFLYDHMSKGPHTPIVRNVHLENVTSSASPRVLSIVGIPEGVIDGIHLRNCTFTGITHPDIVRDAGRITFDGVDVVPAE
jgi:unsaturated rhamnogalacturonyl hydrolase